MSSGDISLRRGAAVATVAQVATLASGALTTILIARVLGAPALGTYALALAILETAVVLAGIGLDNGLTYVVAAERWDARHAVRTANGSALKLGSAGALVIGLAYLLLRHSALNGVSASAAVSLVASLPFALAWRLDASIALAGGRLATYGTLQILQTAAALVLTAALMGRFDADGTVYALSASQAFCALIAWPLVTRGAARRPMPSDPRLLRKAYKFGRQAWGANGLQILNYRLDLLILGAFVTRGDVGVYSVAVSLCGLGWILPQALATALFPKTATDHGATGRSELPQESSDRALATALRQATIITLPTAAALVVVLVAGVPLIYGDGFSSAVGWGLVLIPGIACLGIAKVVSAALLGRGRPDITLRTVLVVTPITLALYAICIPLLGALGAALASSLSYVTSTVLVVYLLQQATGLSARDVLVPRRVDFDVVIGRFRGRRIPA